MRRERTIQFKVEGGLFLHPNSEQEDGEKRKKNAGGVTLKEGAVSRITLLEQKSEPNSARGKTSSPLRRIKKS